MAVIYVKEQGAYIKKLDERIIIEKNKKSLADIPIANVTDLSVIGNVQITTQVIHTLMKAGIDVSFFSFSGEYMGQIASESSKNVFLRFAQYEIYQNIEKRLELARTVVGNKINNQIAVIKGFNWDGMEYDYHSEIANLERQLTTLADKATSNEIMGVEGICSAIYFTSFAHMFKCRIKFDKRNRRPPKDPINIILSLGYTLLTKEVASALDSESFETYLGFLHGIRYGRKSLALDIVEEFRQPVIDRLTITLFNKQMINEFDFEEGDNRTNLTEEGFHKFIRNYEKWMKQPVSSKDSRCFRSIIHAQVSLLKRAIKDNDTYVPYRWGGDVNVSG